MKTYTLTEATLELLKTINNPQVNIGTIISNIIPFHAFLVKVYTGYRGYLHEDNSPVALIETLVTRNAVFRRSRFMYDCKYCKQDDNMHCTKCARRWLKRG